jgi:hypothetical protein
MRKYETGINVINADNVSNNRNVCANMTMILILNGIQILDAGCR